MAVRRPLKAIASGLQEFSDSELDRLSYNIRKAFATSILPVNNGQGRVFIGGASGDSIGTATNSYRTNVTSSVGDGGFTGTTADAGYGPDEGFNPNPAGTNLPFPSDDGGDYPQPLATGVTTEAAIVFRQLRTAPSALADATFDSYGYFVFDQTSEIIVETSETNIFDTVVSDVVYQMREGDEVGTYRLSTSTPTNGGAGTWDNIVSSAFTDTIYTGGVTDVNYNLYLKRSLTTEPGSYVELINYGSGQFNGIDSTDTSDIITNIFLPLVRRRFSQTASSSVVNLNYTLSTTAPNGTSQFNRGTVLDTRLDSTSYTYNFALPDSYSTTSTPSGSVTTQTTYYFYIS